MGIAPSHFCSLYCDFSIEATAALMIFFCNPCKVLIFSPGVACKARGSRSGECACVSEFVSKCVVVSSPTLALLMNKVEQNSSWYPAQPQLVSGIMSVWLLLVQLPVIYVTTESPVIACIDNSDCVSLGYRWRCGGYMCTDITQYTCTHCTHQCYQGLCLQPCTAGCAGEGEACCGGWCCPADIYRYGGPEAAMGGTQSLVPLLS